MLTPSEDQLIFEKSSPGRRGVQISSEPGEPHTLLPEHLKRESELRFPELSELDIVRHYTNLSKKNFSIDTHFYPLGSCTMKYNPKVNEWAASLAGFSKVHPLQPAQTVQGYMQVFASLEKDLCGLTGMDAFTLQPEAGAHGELTGLMIVHAYHHEKNDQKRTKVLVPDSSHGTNPATAALLGYEVIQIRSNARGRVDLEDLESRLGPDVACLMLTNPNTLGLFEEDILKITEAVHRHGGLLYYDGANLNALLGIARPGDMGFDVMHVNLHKTFSTPHGGGGPGAGPVGVKSFLEPFLPMPRIVENKGILEWRHEGEKSIGKVSGFYGNAAVLLRAYVYIRMLGLEGLKRVSVDAILNANFIKEKLKGRYLLPVDEPCMHEFVLSVKDCKDQHIHASDVGKRLLDYGFHAPTVHFPLVVEDALMIEPTETESVETMERFIEAMIAIRNEIEQEPEKVRRAPWRMPIGRPDEVSAARNPILCFRDFLSSGLEESRETGRPGT